MKDTDLLQMALGLGATWQISKAVVDSSQSRLTILVDFPKGSRFACPACGQEDRTVYDTEQKTWRHLNFFQHETFITARVPRTDCSRCGPRLATVPWARPGSGFTLLFETFVMILAQPMPVHNVAQLVGEHDTRLWRVLNHYVESARSELDLSGTVGVGVDETSRRRGHDYASLFVDLDERKVIFATPGTAALSLSSRPPTRSSATGKGSCAGSPPRSLTASWKGSTAWCKRPRRALAGIALHAISSP